MPFDIPPFSISPSVAASLWRSLLAHLNEQQMVVVMITDEHQEKLLDIRFEPLDNIGALMRLLEQSSEVPPSPNAA